MKCEIIGCNKKAKWGIYKTYENGTKLFIRVCDHHEIIIGDENARNSNRQNASNDYR